MDPKPPKDAVRLTGGDGAGELDTWVAAARVDEAVARRSRRRWLQRQAGEDLTIAGVLTELVAHDSAVSMRTTGGSSFTGHVAAVGADFVTVERDAGSRVIVRLSAVAMVRTTTAPGPDESPVPDGTTLASTLTELTAERPEVIVGTGGDEVRGLLVVGGRDVVTIRIGGAAPALVHVAVPSIDHLVVVDG